MPNVRKFNDREKWCPRCKAWLLLGDFGDKPSAKGPLKKQPYCQTCTKSYNDAKIPQYRNRLNAYQRRQARLRNHGITMEQVQKMLVTQAHKCAICDDPITFEDCHIDHDHKTNIVRGLLCGLCNRGLGQFRDSVKRLTAAIRYLSMAAQ